MNPFIRRARINDADRLFPLLAQFATSFTPNCTAFNASLAALLADDAACLLVAEDEGEITGYCLGFDHLTFYANGRVAWVEEIMVQADRWGQGVGRGLMDAFEGWARSRDAVLVALATRRAALFYHALGYEESAAYLRKLL